MFHYGVFFKITANSLIPETNFRKATQNGLYTRRFVSLYYFQKYKLIKEQGIYIEDPSLKPGVPCYAVYSGENVDERDYLRQIFNNKYSSDFPTTLKQSIKEPNRLCIFIASKAGAEGINLVNVRNVHIMESQWNPAIVDQAIGRAIRICSHASLPLEQRTVDVKIYISVFSEEQQKSIDGPNIVPIRRNYTILKSCVYRSFFYVKFQII